MRVGFNVWYYDLFVLIGVFMFVWGVVGFVVGYVDY